MSASPFSDGASATPGRRVPSRTGGPVEAMQALTPLLVENRAWADEHRRLAPPVVEAAVAAGAFVLSAPLEVGGWEASLPEILEATVELGAADPTVAWHSGNSHAMGTVAAYLSATDRDRVFTGPLGPYGFSAAVKGEAHPVEGGYVLSGRWPMVTGALDVTWAALAGVVHDPTGPRQLDNGLPDTRFFLVPATDFTIERTWDLAPTMRGTGSHAVTLHDAFVSDGLAHSWLRPKVIDRPLYSVPTAFAGPVNNAAIAVGILRSAVAHSTDLIAAKSSSVDGSMLHGRPRYTTAIASANSATKVLRAGLLSMAHDVWAEALQGRITRQARAHMWSTAYWILDATRTAMTDLTIASTSTVYTETNPTEAGLRDVHAICAAMEPIRDLQEAAGRVFIGQPPGAAAF